MTPVAEAQWDTVLAENGWTLYDFMAMLCKTVMEREKREQEEWFDLARDDLAGCIQKAKSFFPWLEHSLVYYSDLKMMWSSGNTKLEGFEEREKRAVVLGILARLDTILALKENMSNFLIGRECPVIGDGDAGSSDSFYRFESLNPLTTDQYGILLPRYKCEWQRADDRSMEHLERNPLAIVLNNYFWAPKNEAYHVTHLYCDIRNTGADMGLLNKQPPFKIMTSPLARRAPFVAELNDATNQFFLWYTDRYDGELKDRAQKIFDYASKKKADIVLFPEMMGTEELLSFCAEYVGNAFDYMPKITLLPTYEYREGDKWYNSLRILDKNGECVYQYNKMYAFCFDKKEWEDCGKVKILHYSEPIEDNGEVCVIHAPGIGRIGTVICADVFKKGYLSMLLEDMNVTLLLLPVFSYGKEMMERALSPALKCACDVILCNTCAAWDAMLEEPEERKENRGYPSDFINLYYPCGHKQSGKPLFYSSGCVNCNETACHGCVFLAQPAKTHNGKSTMSKQIRLEEI